MKLALIGYGNVGRALARLLRLKRRQFPFTITGIHTLRHGTAVDAGGLPEDAEPNLVTALPEQLGLRLEPKKVQVDILVIDHADKTPTDN